MYAKSSSPDINNWSGQSDLSDKFITRRGEAFVRGLFFFPYHSDPSLSRRRSLDTYTNTRAHPDHLLGISPSGYFSPSSRPASCATQRRVFVHFSLPLSSRFFYHFSRSPCFSLFLFLSFFSTFLYSLLPSSHPFAPFFSFMFASEGFFAFSRDSFPSRDVAS